MEERNQENVIEQPNKELLYNTYSYIGAMLYAQYQMSIENFIPPYDKEQELKDYLTPNIIADIVHKAIEHRTEDVTEKVINIVSNKIGSLI